MYFFNYLLSANLMLLLMSFNLWVVMAIVISNSAGFLLFKTAQNKFIKIECH